ncbi:hypothetical protein PM082_023143 [Marasmius tenuissimus]|nr:hypothetical protein PM082_023143 [Marasmius tenuissimus]
MFKFSLLILSPLLSMARTKQTSKKSTGAPAPHKALILGTPQVQSRVKRAPALKAANKTCSYTCKSVPLGLGFQLQLTIKRTRVSFYTDQRFLDNQECPSSHREYCTACNNGGQLVLCKLCDGAVCTTCLGPQCVEKYMGRDFQCTRCHLQATPNAPYTGFQGSNETIFLPKGASYRTTAVNPSAKTILVLLFYLEDGLVDPSILLTAALKMRAWAPGRVVYCPIPFNFVDGTGISAHTKAMEKLAAELTDGVLSRITSISLVMATHSDPHRGDFHSEGDNKASVTFTNLVDVLLPGVLRDQIRARGSSSHFVLLACGGFWRMDAPKKEINEFVVGYDV